MKEVEVGRVSHFFNHISVAGISLTDSLSVGDTIHIVGHTTDFTQNVDSMQIEHDTVQTAGSSAEIGIKVKDHVRENDVVYKVVED